VLVHADTVLMRRAHVQSTTLQVEAWRRGHDVQRGASLRRGMCLEQCIALSLVTPRLSDRAHVQHCITLAPRGRKKECAVHEIKW
jgi:hypothetical protein